MYVLFINKDTQKVDRIFEEVTRMRPSQFNTHIEIETHPVNHENSHTDGRLNYIIPISSLCEIEIQTIMGRVW